MVTYTNETWISAAEAKYPNKFDYSKTNYIDSYHKVIVRCRTHGAEFLAPPMKFIRSSIIFLPECCKEKNINIKSNITEEFINEKHNSLIKIDEYYQLKSDDVKLIRDYLIQKQDYKCLLCKEDIENPALDHYHSKKQHGSGLVRGVICGTCNRMVGVIENNLPRNNIDYSDAPEFLINLSYYLKNTREPYIHPSEKIKAPKLMKSSYNKLVKSVGGKQVIPKYTGKFTKPLEKLFKKYDIIPEFKKSSPGTVTP